MQYSEGKKKHYIGKRKEKMLIFFRVIDSLIHTLMNCDMANEGALSDGFIFPTMSNVSTSITASAIANNILATKKI